MTAPCSTRPPAPPRAGSDSFRRLAAGLAAAAFAGAALAGPAAAQTPAPAPPPACTAPANFFPPANTPPPSANGPFNDFCDFHLWAWQSFLWLTQGAANAPLRFQTFPTLADLIAGKMGVATPRLKVRIQKVDGPDVGLGEVAQAQSLGILVDQNGRAVYYSQYLNPQMFDRIVGNGWNDGSRLLALASNPPPGGLQFATGDVELKATWKVLGKGDDSTRFFVRTLPIDQLVAKPDGSIGTDPNSRPVPTRMALVGLHVVGFVKGHPEAIWATFEQRDNAPDLPAQPGFGPVSSHGYTFYHSGTTAIQCNLGDVNRLKLEPGSQVLTPATQVCRQYAHGSKPGTAPTDQNLQAIDSLNASVQQGLAGSTAANYFEVGAVWTTGVLAPNSAQQDRLIGSTLLSNAVIETFTQAVAGSNNCFGCHNTQAFNPDDPRIPTLPGSPLNLSHLVLEAYVATPPAAPAPGKDQP